MDNGYTNFSEVETLARTIYGEDAASSEGQAAVAKEIYNRYHTPGYISQGYAGWKGVCYSPGQYTVITGTSATSRVNSSAPDQYSSSWANCVSLAELLVRGEVPNSQLGTQKFHVGRGYAYPPNAKDKIQIPPNEGNKFYNL